MLRSAVKRFQEPAAQVADIEQESTSAPRGAMLPASAVQAPKIKISPRVDDLINQIGSGGTGYSTVGHSSQAGQPVSGFGSKPVSMSAPVAVAPVEAEKPSEPTPVQVVSAPAANREKTLTEALAAPMPAQPAPLQAEPPPPKAEQAPAPTPFVLPASNDVPPPIPLKALVTKDIKPIKAEKAAEKPAAKTEQNLPEFKTPEPKAPEPKIPELKAPETKAPPASPFATPAAAVPLKKDLPFRIISSAEEPAESAAGSGVSVAESLFSFATKPVAPSPIAKAEAIKAEPAAPAPVAQELPAAEISAPERKPEAAEPAMPVAVLTVVEGTEEKPAAKADATVAPAVVTAVVPAQTEADAPAAKPARPSLKDRFTSVSAEETVTPNDMAKAEAAAPSVEHSINPFTGKPSLADKLADKMQSKAALNPAPMGKIARPAAPRPEYVLPEQKEARFWSKVPLPVRYLMIAAAIFGMYSLFMSWLHEDEPAPLSTVAEGSVDTSAPSLDEAVTVESSHEVSHVTAPVDSKAPPSAIPALPSMPKNPESHRFTGPVRTAAPVEPVIARPVELMPSVTVAPKAEVGGGSLSKAPLTAPASLPSQPSPLRQAANSASLPEAPVGGAVSKQAPAAPAPMPVAAAPKPAAAPTAAAAPEPVHPAPASTTLANTAPVKAAPAKVETVDEKRLLDLLQRP